MTRRRLRRCRLLDDRGRVDGILVLDEVPSRAPSSPTGWSSETWSATLRASSTWSTGMPVVGDLGRLAVAAQLGLQASLGGPHGRQGVVEVDRDADRARLVGDGPGDGLADPPGGVGGELEALAPVELLDGADQAQVAFLDQVEEVDAGSPGVAAGVGHHQPQVGGDEVSLACLPCRTSRFSSTSWTLAVEAALLEARLGARTGFDLLRQLHFELSGEQVVLADRRQVLAHQVGGDPAPVVGELGPLPIAPRSTSNGHECAESSPVRGDQSFNSLRRPPPGSKPPIVPESSF